MVTLTWNNNPLEVKMMKMVLGNVSVCNHNYKSCRDEGGYGGLCGVSEMTGVWEKKHIRHMSNTFLKGSGN